MPRLIDVDEIKLPQGFFEKVDNVPKFYKWLDEQPTVDAETVRHGHWINHFDDLFEMESTIECSICGEKEWMMTIINHNYCPHCGAKMDEEEEVNEHGVG